MTRFIIDENMSPAIAVMLREVGHDAIAVAQYAPRTPDRDILALAVQDNRILATFDTDFGDLIYRWGLPAPPAVILFRLVSTPESEKPQFVARLLLEERDWIGCFWVVTDAAIRNRPLPAR